MAGVAMSRSRKINNLAAPLAHAVPTNAVDGALAQFSILDLAYAEGWERQQQLLQIKAQIEFEAKLRREAGLPPMSDIIIGR